VLLDQAYLIFQEAKLQMSNSGIMIGMENQRNGEKDVLQYHFVHHSNMSHCH
jgi:hypothetical protein